MQNAIAIAEESLVNLERWIDTNGWSGYDPYDLRGTILYQKIARNSILRRGLFYLEYRIPNLLRKSMGIKPKINPKSIGLLALGYLARYQSTDNPGYRDKAFHCLDWLETNTSPGYTQACWGYPFDWYTRRFIPAGTPSSVVSSICGQAFLTAYRLSNNQHYLDIARQISDFFTTHLNLGWLDSRHACYSYTPLDHFHVHNANLFVAAHLTDVWKYTGEEIYLRYIEPVVAYTLADQNPDGSWYYWGPPDQNNRSIDHYHTGFVLRSLTRINQNIERPDWQNAFEQGLNFYLDNFFESDGLPKIYPHNLYPVDIHSCAEAILCLTQFRQCNSTALNLLPTVINWVIPRMQNSSGYFYYRKFASFTVKFPYFRWGQTWMFLALAHLIQVIRSE